MQEGVCKWRERNREGDILPECSEGQGRPVSLRELLAFIYLSRQNRNKKLPEDKKHYLSNQGRVSRSGPLDIVRMFLWV
jgi:hypothetical protein